MSKLDYFLLNENKMFVDYFPFRIIFYYIGCIIFARFIFSLYAMGCSSTLFVKYIENYVFWHGMRAGS